ncbi:MAG: MBL fold metallo-hydrolase [Sphaerochaetaceae bacterium]
MIQVTTLMDNSALPGSDLKTEHGFSCYVEYKGLNLLFDTGASEAFLANAQKLKIDLGHLQMLAISHGHYDHSGGVIPLLQAHHYKKLQMWTGRGFEQAKYSLNPQGLRFSGIDFNHQMLNAHNVQWNTTCSNVTMIYKGVWLVSLFDPIHPIEERNERFVTINEDGEPQVDQFLDEIALVLDVPQGLVMIVGCAHPGILNMVDALPKRFSKPLYALIGGIHLYDASEKRRSIVIDTLLERNIPMISLCHCSGEQAMALAKAKHAGFKENQVGTVFTFA